MTGALERPEVAGAVARVAPVSVVPLHADGFPGRPGLMGRRAGGRSWSPRFVTVSHRREGQALIVESIDERAQLALVTTIEVGDAMTVTATLTNTAARRYSLDALTITLPLPAHADELLRFDGRWAREFQPVRSPWTAVRCCRRTSEAARRTSVCHCSSPAPTASANGAARCGASMWHGARTTPCSPSASPTAADTCKAASCCTPARSFSNPASRTPHPWSWRCTPTAASRRPPGDSIDSCDRARRIRPRRDRSCSTPGRPSTSTTTPSGCVSSPTSPPPSVSSGSSSTTDGSGRDATTRPGSVTGGFRPMCTPTGWRRSSTTSPGSGWSSGSGSSPRWSTPTANCCGRIPSGRW